MNKIWYFASAVLLISWVFIGGYILLNQKPKRTFEIIKYPVFTRLDTITLPAFEVEHDTKQVIKMGWDK